MPKQDSEASGQDRVGPLAPVRRAAAASPAGRRAVVAGARESAPHPVREVRPVSGRALSPGGRARRRAAPVGLLGRHGARAAARREAGGALASALRRPLPARPRRHVPQERRRRAGAHLHVALRRRQSGRPVAARHRRRPRERRVCVHPAQAPRRRARPAALEAQVRCARAARRVVVPRQTRLLPVAGDELEGEVRDGQAMEAARITARNGRANRGVPSLL